MTVVSLYVVVSSSYGISFSSTWNENDSNSAVPPNVTSIEDVEPVHETTLLLCDFPLTFHVELSRLLAWLVCFMVKEAEVIA